MTDELLKELNKADIKELDKILSKIEILKEKVQKSIIEVKEEDLMPKRENRGTKNK